MVPCWPIEQQLTCALVRVCISACVRYVRECVRARACALGAYMCYVCYVRYVRCVRCVRCVRYVHACVRA